MSTKAKGSACALVQGSALGVKLNDHQMDILYQQFLAGRSVNGLLEAKVKFHFDTRSRRAKHDRAEEFRVSLFTFFQWYEYQHEREVFSVFYFYQFQLIS